MQACAYVCVCFVCVHVNMCIHTYRRDGQPGTCLKRGEHVADAAVPPAAAGSHWESMDYVKMDLRNLCAARGWVWRHGRCVPT